MVTVRAGGTTFDGHRLSGRVVVGTDEHVLTMSSRTRLRRPSHLGDVWLPLAIFPAMRTGADLEMDDPVSPRLLRSVGTAQRVLSTWYPELTPVQVRAPVSRTRSRRGAASAMQLFTGGVDSFYTLLRHPEVRTLLYVHDSVHQPGRRSPRRCPPCCGRWQPARAGRCSRSTATCARCSTATATGAPTRTGPRSPRQERWPPARRRRCTSRPRTPTSSCTRGARTRSWTTSGAGGTRRWAPTAAPHDGADASRIQKIAALVDHPTALAHLRVCWRTATDELNCSSCEKCVRTMTSLEILGRLSDATTFRGPLDLAAVRAVELGSQSDLSFSTDNLAAARAVGREDVAAAVAASIERSGPV